MLTTIEILELIREKHGNCTDYRLAKLLEISPQAIHHHVKKGGKMRDETALKAAELLELPPFYVLACIQAENAANDLIFHVWESMAAQFLPANLPGLVLQQKLAV